jgi:ureidoacrylate peracid hydrolase
MHPFELPKAASDRIMARRGKLHIYESLDPGRTALLVIDMQNNFLQEGSLSEVPVAREIVPNINRLAAALRRAGGTVAWVQASIKSEGPTAWTSYFNYVASDEFGKRVSAAMAEDSESFALWPGLDVVDGDLRSVKNRYSAFLPGASDLPEQLSSRGIDTLLITGTLTEICCESTARDAMMLNYKTIMVSDGNASRSDEEHMATLRVFLQHFGDVRTTDEAIKLLGAEADKNAPGRAAE